MSIKDIMLYGGVLLALQLSACSEEEDLNPSGIKENYFEVPEDAMDPESVLRRNFYEQEKIYLLFNDTLRHEQIGTDRYGNVVYFTETVDLAYTITSMSDIMYRFEYIQKQDQKEVFVRFVQENIFPGFSEKLRPYSVLLVDSIDGYVKNNGTYELWKSGYDLVIGSRCTAIARNKFEKMDEEERKNLAVQLISEILTSGMDASLFTDFDKYGSAYNNRKVGYKGINDVREVGFLEPNVYYGVNYFPDKTLDRSQFVKLLIESSESDVLREYELFPQVIEKYYIMQALLNEIGYIIER